MKRSNQRSRWIPLASALAFLTTGSPALAAKIDTVVLENGNLVTGEIKELQQGKLKYSTDSMGTVYIEWDEIEKITRRFAYELIKRDMINPAQNVPAPDMGTDHEVMGWFVNQYNKYAGFNPAVVTGKPVEQLEQLQARHPLCRIVRAADYVRGYEEVQMEP